MGASAEEQDNLDVDASWLSKERNDTSEKSQGVHDPHGSSPRCIGIPKEPGIVAVSTPEEAGARAGAVEEEESSVGRAPEATPRAGSTILLFLAILLIISCLFRYGTM